MASNKQQTSINQQTGQFNQFKLNQLNAINQLNTATNQLANTINSTLNTTINEIVNNKKKTKNLVKKDAIKQSQQFNYQNLNVNLNPKEKIVQDQSIKLNKNTDLLGNQLQFKIVQPNEEDNVGQPSLKFKISTTRKPGNSELRKLRIPNQNLNNSINLSTNNVQNSSSTIAPNPSDLTVIKNLSLTNNLNSSTTTANNLASSSTILPANQTDLITTIPNIQNNNKLASIQTKHQIVNKPTDEHEQNCMCYLHSEKNKKELASNKQKFYANNDNRKKNNKSRLSSSSSTSNSSSSASSRSSSCSKKSGDCLSRHSNKLSSRSSSSSSSDSNSSSNSSKSSGSSSDSSNSSNCSSSSSSNCSSRSSSTNSSRSGSCRDCGSHNSSRSSSTSSSGSSSSDASSNSSIKQDNDLKLNRSRSRQKESNFKLNENNSRNIENLNKLGDLTTQQLLNNVNETLIKHQKQKLNLNLSPNDLPSPINSLNNNLNSQPSSVSCESNCYSPSVSINSINSPSCSTLRKQDPLERQKLRSYRLPHLTAQQQKQLQQQQQQSKKDKESDKNEILNEQNKGPSNQSQEPGVNEKTNSQTELQTKKLKKQKLKEEKKKEKTKKTNLKKKNQTDKLVNENNNLELKQKAKKKVKKVKQTTEDGKLKKKKGKKKLKSNKLISDPKLIENLDMSQLLNESNLKDINNSKNSELSKMCLLMNANLNSGIPPNIDTEVILNSLSSLIKEDKNLLIKNQYLINQNSNANKLINNNNQESNKLNLTNKESQSTSNKNDKSPDSGIQSQSESPNQLANQKSSQPNKQIEKNKKIKKSTKNDLTLKNNPITDSNAPPSTAANSSKTDNLPKTNNLLISDNQGKNIPTTTSSASLNQQQKDPILFNQYMDSSIQTLIKNLQKTSANLNLSNLNQLTALNPILNSNLNPIKPKSIPSDLITLTEFLLNMNNNNNKSKDTILPSTSNSTNSVNVNFPLTNDAISVNKKNSQLPSASNNKSKKTTRSSELDLLKSIKLTKLNKEDYSFKKITDQQQPINSQPTKIKNTDLWRNNESMNVNSPLNIEELNKRLRSTKADLINSSNKKPNDKQSNKSNKKSVSKKSGKQKQIKNDEQDYLLNIQSKELNKHLKKNSLSDILCTNELDLETNSNQQSRSVSSLSQNHYSSKDKSSSKKKKKSSSKHKFKKDGFINELSEELNKLYLNLIDDFIKLEIIKGTSANCANKLNKSVGAFKCIKYGKNNNKKSKQKQQSLNQIQFNNSLINKLMQTNSDAIEKLEKQDKTKKRKKNSSFSQQQELEQSNLIIKLNEDSQNDNTNEHSLPLKKRHHRHTENKCDSDLIDSSNSSSTTELLKINLRTKSTKSTNKKIKSNLDLNEQANTANQAQLELTNKLNSAELNSNKNAVSQINSCVSEQNSVTWVNSNKQTNNNEHPHTATSSGSSSFCNTIENKKQQNSSINKTRSINVDNKLDFDSILTDYDSKELDEFNDSNMVITKKNSRKLRSNNLLPGKSEKMGNVKSKFLINNKEHLINNDNLNIKNERLKDKNINENNNVLQNGKQDKKNKKLKSKIETNGTIDLDTNLINTTNNDNSLKSKTAPVIKKRRKQNKTGFDKPKKKKKPLPKLVDKFEEEELINNKLLIVDNTDLVEETLENKIKDNLDKKKKDELNGKKKINLQNKKLTNNKLINKTDLNNTNEDSDATIDDDNNLIVPNKLKSVKKQNKNKHLKRKLPESIDKSKVKKVKLEDNKLEDNELEDNKLEDNKLENNKINNKKHIDKLRNKNNNRFKLLNKATKKLIKKSTNLINKSAAIKKVNKKQQLNKSSSRIKSISSLKSTKNNLLEETKLETPIVTETNQDDDFEEIVLKIHSVYSTTLIKKPKKDKIKIKGPTKKYYKAGLFSDTFKIDPPIDTPSTTNTSASNTPIHQCETPILSVEGETVQSDNDESLLIQDSNSNSDDFNIDQEEGKLRFEDKDAQYNGKERVYTDNDEFSTLLPPPCYVYNKERRKLNDFVLPYDIWWQHVNNQLTHTVNPAKNYKRIKGNVFYDVKPTSNFEEQSCNCVKPKDLNQLGCGDDCLNRAMWVECNPALCPCGDQCSNQKLLKNEWAPGLERFLTRNRGFGVRTTQLIKKSTFIIEYIGEIVSEKVFKQRMAETYSADSHHYCLNITSGILIDGYRMANEGRFVNHSCEPNCEMQKWSVNGYYRVGLFALRDIQPNEEVTYDYNFYNFNLEHQQVCHCGSSKCRGVIGGKTKRDNLQLKQDTATNLTSMEKLIIVKSTLKKSDNKRKDCYLSKVENSGTFENTILSLDKKKLSELIKSFSYTASKYIRKHNLFLIRNFEKFRQQHNKNVEKKRKLKNAATKDEIYYTTPKNNSKQDIFNPLYLTSNSNRPVRTRGFAKVQDNEEFIKLYKLCNLFKEICQCFVDSIEEKLTKNSNDKQLEIVFNHLKELSKRRKNENQEIDLSILERNILSGQYKTEESFKLEIDRLFKNATKHFKEEKDDNLLNKLKKLEEIFYKILNDKFVEFNNLINIDNKNDNKNKEKLDDSFEAKLSKNKINLPSSLRISLAAITRTTKETFKILHDTKQINQFNLDHLDNLPISKNEKQKSTDNEVQELQPLYTENELPKFKNKELIDNEEIIRCICTLNKDDGEMIQCDGPNCNVWQHAHCMQANVNEETYLCERCNPREIDREIKLEKPPIDGVENWTYYFTFTIGDNIIKIGDTVYLERENKRDKTKTKKETQSKKDLITFTDFDGKKMSKTDVDIFRIEHLYKTSDGKKFVYGHHCLRPSETFHEPTRRFFSNEVLSSPLSGSAPLESIKGICYVLDLSTYCKGRPIGSREEDIYICEFKVCKKARSFSKIGSKNNFGINTKPYCFNYFEERLHPKRTFSPHNITIIKKDNKTAVKSLEKPKVEKEQQKNQAPKIEQIDLTEADVDNINKLHLRTYVQKQFNIHKLIEKIAKLNEENSEEDNQIEKMEIDNNSIKKE